MSLWLTLLLESGYAACWQAVRTQMAGRITLAVGLWLAEPQVRPSAPWLIAERREPELSSEGPQGLSQVVSLGTAWISSPKLRRLPPIATPHPLRRRNQSWLPPAQVM